MTQEVKVERVIAAPQDEVFDAWLNPEIPGTPFQEHEKLIMNAKVDGLWYWLIRKHPHYGRFTEIQRPARIRHTWMSQSTRGEETTVTVTFRKKGDETVMTLAHSDLTTADMVKSHDKGWTMLVDDFVAIFSKAARR